MIVYSFTNKILKPCSDGQDRWKNRGFNCNSQFFVWKLMWTCLFVALISKVQRTFMSENWHRTKTVVISHFVVKELKLSSPPGLNNNLGFTVVSTCCTQFLFSEKVNFYLSRMLFNGGGEQIWNLRMENV